MEVDNPKSDTGSSTGTGTFPVPTQGVLSEVTLLYQPCVEKLFAVDSRTVQKGIKEIKNFVIGNNKMKANFIVLGAVPRLVYLIQAENVLIDIKTEAAVVLGSLAKGIDTSVQSLVDQKVPEVICKFLSAANISFYEACVRCLRTIMVSSTSSCKVLYSNSSFVVINLLQNFNQTACTQMCTCEILSHSCKTREHQDILLKLGALNMLDNILVTGTERAKAKALDALAVICYKNIDVCRQCIVSKIDSESLVSILIQLLTQSLPNSVQIRAAQCLVFISRMGVLEPVDLWNIAVIRRVLPSLVRMCGPECSSEERVMGAEALAYLTEVDPSLQRLAYVCEQFPQTLETYFKHLPAMHMKTSNNMKHFKHAIKYEREMRRAGLLSYAALLSNDEDIRKQVSTESLISHIAESMLDSCSSIRMPALRCLLSLSRSIQLLRTTFQDVGIWKALTKLSQDPDLSTEEAKLLSSVLCNMMLDFCPSKDELKSAGLVQVVCRWLNVEPLKFNALWCLMNMCFEAHSNFKREVLMSIGFERILQLLTDNDRNVTVRMLGLLRNTLHPGNTEVVKDYGVTIIQACKHVFTVFADAGTGDPTLCAEFEHVLAHTVCVLACIAASDSASSVQSYLQSQEDMLRQITGFLLHSDIDLQLATVAFIRNFLQAKPMLIERKNLLNEFGVQTNLQQLQSTSKRILYEHVEETLHLFQGCS